MTITLALQTTTSKLSEASDAPTLDAERLLLHILGRSESAWLYAHGDQTLTSAQEKMLTELVERRLTGEPLAYILGEWEFYGRSFLVTPDVLIPRPETENLVEAALQYIEKIKRPEVTIADIGTGSGCIAITLACELESRNSTFKILATDISPAALAVARKNADRYGVTHHIEFLEGDMLQPIADRQVDLVVSNPPYVPSQELDQSHFALRASRDKIETRGLDFEPRIALDGGPDGQKFVEQIKNAGIPAFVEGTKSYIDSANL